LVAGFARLRTLGSLYPKLGQTKCDSKDLNIESFDKIISHKINKKIVYNCVANNDGFLYDKECK